VSTNLRPGNVLLDEIVLFNDRKMVSLDGKITEFNFWENIFDPTINGILHVAENENLISNFPIVGEEYLSLKFRHHENEEQTTILLRVYKVTNKVQSEATSQIAYKLHLISDEAYRDMTTNVSRALTGTSDTIIMEILTTELQSQKQFIWSPAANNIKLVSPLWSPFKCISYATQKAITQNTLQSANFMFFETVSGYKFKSFDELVSQPESHFFKYTHERPVDSNLSVNIKKEEQQILSMTTSKIVDQFERVKFGLHNTLTYDHDLLFKTISKYENNTEFNWDLMKHLNENQPFSSTFTNTREVINQSHSYHRSHGLIARDNSALVANTRISSLMRTEMFKVNLEIYGKTKVEVGQVIYLKIGNNTETDKSGEDKLYSGRYLITSVGHRISPAEHKISLEVIKESFVTKIF